MDVGGETVFKKYYSCRQQAQVDDKCVWRRTGNGGSCLGGRCKTKRTLIRAAAAGGRCVHSRVKITRRI